MRQPTRPYKECANVGQHALIALFQGDSPSPRSLGLWGLSGPSAGLRDYVQGKASIICAESQVFRVPAALQSHCCERLGTSLRLSSPRRPSGPVQVTAASASAVVLVRLLRDQTLDAHLT